MQIKTADGIENVGSAGVAGAGLGLGIAGTALGLLQNGGLNGILGGGNNVQCNDTRTISALESEIAKLKSERYTDKVGTEVYAEHAMTCTGSTLLTRSPLGKLPGTN